MITSNLDWDEEPLMDKFKEGLKPSVRSMMIYFPQEPKDLEELYGRSQKIDREQWNQRTQQGYGQRRNDYGQRRSFHERRDTRQERNSQKESRHYPTKDRDGDVVMIGAKVDMEKAKKERLWFNCGKAGHQARFCRNKKTFAKKEGTTRISMMTYRKDPGQEKLQYVPTPENSNMFTEESESEINYNQLCRDEITGHDDNYEHRQTIRKEMEAEFFAAGLGKDQGETGSPQTDEFEDEPSVNDADLQLKNELISEWRMNV